MTIDGSWLGAGEVAGRLGVPVRVVLELAWAGTLPAERRPVGAPRFCWPDVVSAWGGAAGD